MSDFRVTVERLTIEPHPNADRLELARVGDYLSIVMKGQFKTGDLGVYIPEGSIVPQELLAEMGLTGKLAGPEKNRVKAMRLRGVLSQGLVYPVRQQETIGILAGYYICRPPFANEAFIINHDIGRVQMAVFKAGEEVGAFLGITKYVPKIPASMDGEVFVPSTNFLPKFDVEDIKRFPNVLEDGEPVMITEKVHGTCVIFGAIPSSHEPIEGAIDGRVLVASKGVGAKGLAFKDTPGNRESNVYLRTLLSLKLIERVKALADANGAPIVLLGEIAGKGIQDLYYGLDEPQFRLFDIYLPDGQSFASAIVTGKLADKFSIPHVPIMYHGPWSKNLVERFRDGGEWVSRIDKDRDPINADVDYELDGPPPEHMREGIVIRAAVERRDPLLGRVILKAVSPEYLTRDSLDATEFQ